MTKSLALVSIVGSQTTIQSSVTTCRPSAVSTATTSNYKTAPSKPDFAMATDDLAQTTDSHSFTISADMNKVDTVGAVLVGKSSSSLPNSQLELKLKRIFKQCCPQALQVPLALELLIKQLEAKLQLRPTSEIFKIWRQDAIQSRYRPYC